VAPVALRVRRVLAVQRAAQRVLPVPQAKRVWPVMAATEARPVTVVTAAMVAPVLHSLRTVAMAATAARQERRA
jgi:hypothetical protein